MKLLLDLFAAVALFVWGTHLVRTGVLRAYGANLRHWLHRNLRSRFSAALAGAGVTTVIQSSTATSLMAASFVGQGLISLPAALAVMRGADVGTATISVLFSADVSWLSPLLLLIGVVLSMTRRATNAGKVGGIFIGLGLMLLALHWVVQTTEPMFESEVMHAVIAAITGDLLLEITVGAALAMIACSSLAVVLIVAAMAASSVVSLDVAMAFVLGANLGNGLLAVVTTAKSPLTVRQVTLGNLLCKVLGVILALPFMHAWLQYMEPILTSKAQFVVLFHLAFNLASSALLIWLTNPISRLIVRVTPALQTSASPAHTRPMHLDPSVLSMPSLAISCAAREALHQADVVENMLVGMLTVIHTNDLQLAKELRKMDDTVDKVHADIKDYLTKISRETLDEEESRRWTEIIRFTINLEQAADIIERAIKDIESKKIKHRRRFSKPGMAEIAELHQHLLDNLRLGMSVFLTGNTRDAKKLLAEKERFSNLEYTYANTHLDRLMDRSASSMETSSLHIDLISNMKRINSHICAIAYSQIAKTTKRHKPKYQ